MGNFENSSQPIQFNQQQKSEELIPGLPHDLALQCLLRLPFTSLPSLKLVSSAWNSTLSHPSFFSLRLRLSFSQHLLCLIQPLSPPPPPPLQPPQTAKLHPSAPGSPPSHNLNIYTVTRPEWRRLSLPIPTFAQCVAVPAAAKLVVLGGWDPSTLEPLNRVLVVDLIKGTWKEGSPMPTARSFFSAMAVGGASTVYVAGGHDRHKNALRSAEAYDVAADRWWKLPPMAEERDESQGFSFDGFKFWVVSGYGTESQGRFRSDAEVFDPEIGTWSRVDGVWPYVNTTPKSTVAATVVGGGRRRWWLFFGGGELKEFRWEEKQWKGVNSGRVPKEVSGSSSISLIDVGNGDGRIFVMGSGRICDGENEGAFVLERRNEDGKGDNDDKNGGVIKWERVSVPCRFLGLPFSAASLLI